MLPLEEYLGEAAKIIDMIVDQSPEGIEVLRGTSTYTFDGNWKLTAENGADGYHVSSVHWNYAATTSRRSADGKVDTVKAMNAGKWAQQGGGSYSFKHGHLLLWTNWSNPEDRPLASKRDEWVEKFGEARADWMLGRSRNLCLYPNVYLMDQFSSQIRVVRPIAVNKSEVTIYCIAPKGEAPESRERRLRQYEDFFNATGMATPDDLEEFRSCQRGYEARAVRWNDMSRGATHWIKGPDATADLIGLKPEMSCIKTEDEGLYIGQHEYWLQTMKKAYEAERNGRGARRSRIMLSYEAIQAFLYAEARSLDEGRWTDWLEFYADDVEFYMPSWDDDDKLTTDPHNEVSLIYYPSKQGLEDRVFRIQTDRSSATTPDTRTGHSIHNIEVLSQDENSIHVTFNWATHSFRYDIVDLYFGSSQYTIDTSGEKPLIKRKYVVLKNDYIHHLLDIYHI